MIMLTDKDTSIIVHRASRVTHDTGGQICATRMDKVMSQSQPIGGIRHGEGWTRQTPEHRISSSLRPPTPNRDVFGRNSFSLYYGSDIVP